MYNSSPNSLDINIKNTNNTNTNINFNFNIGSSMDRKFLSPSLKSSKEPSSITGRKIEQNNVLNYESSSINKYPILIEESKKKSASKLTAFSKKSPIVNMKSLGKLTQDAKIEKPKLTRKTQRLLSPSPPSNLKEKLKETNKEVSKGKKKKKKSSKKKKTHRPISIKETPQQNPTFRNLSQFQDFIKQNLKKHHMQKIVQEQRKQSEAIRKDEKQKSLHNLNQETRRLNSGHRKNASTPKFPWGFNQKKYISFFEKMAEVNSQKNMRKKNPSLWLDEKTRRERLGLGFLNEMNLEDFQKILQKKKPDSLSPEENDQKKNHAHKESNPEILNWMQDKKKKIEEERWNSIKAMLEEQQRVRKNIQELEMKVTNSRCSVKSTNALNNRSKYAKSTHYMGKMEMEEKENPSPKGFAENEESQIYEMLQKQVKQIVHGTAQSNQNLEEENKNENIYSSSKHTKSKSEDFQGKILQKKRMIQEQFQILSQKMEKNLGIIKTNVNSSSPEKNNHHQNSQNPQNKRTKDTNEQKKGQNSSGGEGSISNKESFSPESMMSNSQNQQTPPKKGKGLFEEKKQKTEDNVIYEENQLEFASEEEEMLFIINTAATMIQKVWKGYHTRRMLNYYVLMTLKEMNPEISHSPLDINERSGDANSPDDKSNNKNLRRSHSLDEIYEPGNLFKEKDEKIPSKKESLKIEGVFNEQEREELNKKMKQLQNKTGEDFDYYQLGGKNEEIQFDIKASENIPKMIDNNLFYGRKIEDATEAKTVMKTNDIEPSSMKKDLDKSDHITNLSHLIEDNMNKQIIVSEKNIQISNMASMNTMNNFQDRRGSIDNEPEPEELKMSPNEGKTKLDEKFEAKEDMKWEDFLEYMKLFCKRKELADTATKFINILEKLPIENIQSMMSPSSLKDQEIQTSVASKSQENSEDIQKGLNDIKAQRKGSKNLQIEIESDEENEKQESKQKNKVSEKPNNTDSQEKKELNQQKPEKIKEKTTNDPINEETKVENYEDDKNTPLKSDDNKDNEVLGVLSKIGDLRRAVGSEKLLRTQSLSWNPSPAGNSTPTIFEQEPFRDFTSKKIREFLNKENMLNLIRFREQALYLRHKAQIDHMKKMLDNKRVSPRTFKSKSEEIEKWITMEKEDMLRKKMEIEKGWLSAAVTMRRTQRDLMFMRKSLGKQDKFGGMEFKHSFSEEDFDIFPGIEEKGRSSLEILQIDRLEIQDEVLKASNEKKKENRPNLDLHNDQQVVEVQRLNLQEGSQNINFEENLMNKELTIESQNTNSPKILIESCKNTLEEFIKPSSEPLKIPLNENKTLKSKSLELFEKNIEELKYKKATSEKEEEKKGKELAIESVNLIKQKVAEIPKFLSHDDFGNLSVSSSLGSLSNSKSEVMFLTSKNKELDKKIEHISGMIFEQLLDEFKTEAPLFDLLKGKKIPVAMNSAQKSPKVAGFVAGKDIQEHFPPLNSPSREDTMGNKRFKEQILSPKNLSQYRVKSEPDEKMAKGAHGILSNIEAVKEYSNELIELIKRKYKEKFLKNMNVPLGLVPVEKLKLLQLNLNNDTTSSSEAYENSYMYPAFYKEPILSVEIFTDLEKVLFKKDCLSNRKRIYELQQIHNKAIFDSFNEALDVLRPYGLRGRPSPWRPVSKQIVFRPIDDKGMIEILNKAKEKLLEWSSNLCGFIHDKEESQFLEGILLDEECLGQIREDRMARMLAQEVIECEEDWVEYGDEETEVGVELGDLIFEKMVLDGIEAVLFIKEKRSIQGYFNDFST